MTTLDEHSLTAKARRRPHSLTFGAKRSGTTRAFLNLASGWESLKGGLVMPVKKLKAFLDSHAIRYVTIHHSPAHTAQEMAASAHIPGGELAKTVIVKLDGEMAMAVLPASFQI